MSTLAATAAAAPRRLGVSQARVILSEWTKLRSVRSTRWSLFAAVVLTIGFPILASSVISSHWGHRSPAERAHFNALDPALVGALIAQLAIGVLGVLAITAEYSTGMIRASFTAVPKRLPVLWGKAVVFATVTFVLLLPAVLIAFFASQSILSRHHVNLAFSDPHVARAVIGTALYLTVIVLFSLGIGAIVRNTAGGIAVFAGILFVIPPLMNVLPSSWNNAISPYLPNNAGAAIMAIRPDVNRLAPWTGFGVFCAYAAGTLAVAAILLRRRDT